MSTVHLLPNPYGANHIFTVAGNQTIIWDYTEDRLVKTLPDTPLQPRTFPSSATSVLLPLRAPDYNAQVLLCGGSSRDMPNPKALEDCYTIDANAEEPKWQLTDYLPNGPQTMSVSHLPSLPNPQMPHTRNTKLFHPDKKKPGRNSPPRRHRPHPQRRPPRFRRRLHGRLPRPPPLTLQPLLTLRLPLSHPPLNLDSTPLPFRRHPPPQRRSPNRRLEPFGRVQRYRAREPHYLALFLQQRPQSTVAAAAAQRQCVPDRVPR